MNSVERKAKMDAAKKMARDAIRAHGQLIIYYWIADYSTANKNDQDSIWCDLILDSIFEYLEEQEWFSAVYTLSSNIIPERKSKKTKTVLYIMKSKETSLFKIGITKNLEKRSGTISSHENGIEVINKYEFEKRVDAQTAETIIHRMLKSSRVCGEWFSGDETTIKNLVNNVIISFESKARQSIK